MTTEMTPEWFSWVETNIETGELYVSDDAPEDVKRKFRYWINSDSMFRGDE